MLFLKFIPMKRATCSNRLAGTRRWLVLNYMHDYWAEHGVAPDVRHVVKHLANTQGMDKKLAKKELFKLFPYGYVKQACKIAGMQRPRAWSTG